MARLPLRHRLPNPPAVFVGRADELERLRQAIERAPVAVVWGLGGLGKTSLVLRALHQLFPERVERTVFVQLRANDPPEQIGMEIVRALARARGDHEDVRWERLLGDPELLVGRAIDLAEDADLWVVLDDLHHGDDAVAAELLVGLARYARRSRWIAISRRDPSRPRGTDAATQGTLARQLAGQVLALGGMGADELALVARETTPGLGVERCRELAAQAGGSPWRLRQIASHDGRPGDATLLAGLPPGADELLLTLTVSGVPLAPAQLALLGLTAPDGMVEALAQHGFVEALPEGIRAHEAARPLLAATFSPERKRRAADAIAVLLRDSDEPAHHLESIRLLAERGETAAVAQRLAHHGPALLRAGYAPRLWTVIAGIPRLKEDACLDSWRLRVGVELGTAEVLAVLGPVHEPTVEDTWHWCRALSARGEVQAAIEHARLVATTAPVELAFEARLHEARALIVIGRPQEALVLLGGLDPATSGRQARRAALLAECHAFMARYDDAQHIASEAVRGLAALDFDERVEVGNQLLGVLLVLGDLARAAHVIRILEPAAAPALHRSRFTLLYRAVLDVSLGELDEAARLFQLLEPMLEPTSLAGLILQHGDIFRRFIAGDMGDLAGRITHATDMARAAGSFFFQRWCGIWSAYLAIVVAEPSAPEPAAGGDLLGLLAVQRLVADLHAVRRGATDIAPWTDLPPIWDRVLGGMVRAFANAWRGEHVRAREEIQQSLGVCRVFGYRQFELEQRAFACELAILSGAWGEVATEGQELAAIATACGSPRFGEEAQWYAAMIEPTPRPSSWERWAGMAAVAPMAARRARMLLGDDAPCDGVDRAVVAALLARWGDPRLVRHGNGEAAFKPGWGLDGARRRVWLPDGSEHDLSSRALMWKALERIAEGGGEATLEHLARSLWDLADYHPHRDNARIHTLVSRIRQWLEPVPTEPTRLVTTADGYRFGAAEPVRWLRSSAG